MAGKVTVSLHVLTSQVFVKVHVEIFIKWKDLPLFSRNDVI